MYQLCVPQVKESNSNINQLEEFPRFDSEYVDSRCSTIIH